MCVLESNDDRNPQKSWINPTQSKPAGMCSMEAQNMRRSAFAFTRSFSGDYFKSDRKSATETFTWIPVAHPDAMPALRIFPLPPTKEPPAAQRLKNASLWQLFARMRSEWAASGCDAGAADASDGNVEAIFIEIIPTQRNLLSAFALDPTLGFFPL